MVNTGGCSNWVCLSVVVVEVVGLGSGKDCVGDVGEFGDVLLDLLEDVGAVHGVEGICNVD